MKSELHRKQPLGSFLAMFNILYIQPTYAIYTGSKLMSFPSQFDVYILIPIN